MSRFQVITGELVAASSAIDTAAGTLDGTQHVVSQSGGALAGTPAAAAYDALIASLHTTTAGIGTASTELSTALIAVANAYQQADDAAADDVTGARANDVSGK